MKASLVQRARHYQEGDDLAPGDHLQAIGGIGSATDGSIHCESNEKVPQDLLPPLPFHAGLILLHYAVYVATVVALSPLIAVLLISGVEAITLALLAGH